VNISFNVTSKEVLDYLREKSIKIAGVEQKELLESIKQELIKAVEDGKSLMN